MIKKTKNASVDSSGNWFVDKLNLYQSANSGNDSIKNNFVVRKADFDIIVSELKNKTAKDPLQHELILGRRGSGKSTLLRRIQAEIEENETLQKKYIAINLAEEQAGIYRLFDLWDEVLKELVIKLNIHLNLKSYASFDNNQNYTRYLYSVINETLVKSKRKVVLLLDNFDRIVGNFSDDGHLLRETLLNYNDVQIIAGSTRMDEHFWKHDQPFYEFFRRHRLEALSTKEIVELLNHWSKLMNLPELTRFAKNNIGKIESIRILTDGLPRTLQFFIQLLLQNSDLYGYEYLRKVMDNVTTLYQERLNYLPAAQRKIIAEMAFMWEACSTKELVEKCRMESKLISAQIKQLSNAGIIDTITTDKKNHLYRITERFFNMWLIVTQGNPEQKRKAKWLSIFLETWYDATDLKRLAKDHIASLKNKKILYDKALVFAKAFGQSKYLTTTQRDELIDLTLALKTKETNTQILELPKKYCDLRTEITEHIKKEKFEKAHQLVSEIENEEDGVKFFFQGNIFREEQNLKEAEKYYLLAIEKDNVNAMNNLANIYANQQKLEEAEKYYRLAIEKSDVNAMNDLAVMYKNQQKFEEAEKYYLLAIKKGHVGSLINLALIYANQQKFEEAEKYYLLAIEKRDTTASNNLANIYANQEKFENAEKYYRLAIEKSDVNAMNDLAVMYKNQEKFEEAEKYYLLSIAKGNLNDVFNLGLMYENQGKFKEAEKYYLLAIAKGNLNAVFNLALMYENQQKFEEAEKYYLLAIEKHGADCLNGLGRIYIHQERFEEAERYYLLAIEKGNINTLNNLAVLYAKQQKFAEAEKYYLLAIEKDAVDADFNLAVLYDNQEKFEEAERYFLLAIEKGNTDALLYLAILYYNQNLNHKAALELINSYHAKSTEENKSMDVQIIIEIWNGIFDDLQGKIEDLLKDNEYEHLESFFLNLLAQEQLTLVLNLFTGEAYGEQLQKRYTLLYYAVLLLNNRTENNLMLRIPPEITSTVDSILEAVKERQQFYTSKKL